MIPGKGPLSRLGGDPNGGGSPWGRHPRHPPSCISNVFHVLPKNIAQPPTNYEKDNVHDDTVCALDGASRTDESVCVVVYGGSSSRQTMIGQGNPWFPQVVALRPWKPACAALDYTIDLL